MSDTDEDPVADEACAMLRQGLGRSRKLAEEARQRLSELTSDTVYPGPASLILADHVEGAGPDRDEEVAAPEAAAPTPS